MKNKKAFTVTEIIVALIILGIIMTIAIPNISKLQQKFKDEYYKELDGSVLQATKEYYKEKTNNRPVNILDYNEVNYSDLSLDKELKGYKDDSLDGSKAVIVKIGDEYIYKNCLIVNGKKLYDPDVEGPKYITDPSAFNMTDYEQNICYFAKDDSTNSGEFTVIDKIHYGNYSNDQIKSLITPSTYVERKDKDGNVLYRVKTSNDELPTNINEFANDVRSDNSGTKSFTLKYTDVNKKDVKIFRHDVPEIKINGKFITNNEISYNAIGSLDLKCDVNPSFDKDNTEFKGCEMKINDGNWENINASKLQQTRLGKVYFRVVGTSKDKRIDNIYQYGKQSNAYTLKSDNPIKYKYLYTYNCSGNGYKGKEVKYGDIFKVELEEQKPGYEYVSWNIKSSSDLCEDAMYGDSIKTVNKKIIQSKEDNKIISKYTIPYKENDKINKFFMNLSAIDDANVQLEIQCKKIVYNITYNLNGGALLTYKTNPENYNVETETFTLNNPIREGYEFIGWTGSNGNTPQTTVKIEKGSTGDKSYTAIWKSNTYTLSFDSNGGVFDSCGDYSSKYTDNRLITCSRFNVNNNIAVISKEPTRQGYRFDGWYTDKIGGNKLTATTISITKDTTYYAHWELIDYEIAYNLYGGVLPTGITNPEKYTIETETFTLNNPIREGYEFIGWTGSNGNTPQTTVKIEKGSTGDKGYFAHWKEIPVYAEIVATGDINKNDKPYTMINNGSNISPNYVYYSVMINKDSSPRFDSIDLYVDSIGKTLTCKIDNNSNFYSGLSNQGYNYDEYTRYFCKYNNEYAFELTKNTIAQATINNENKIHKINIKYTLTYDSNGGSECNPKTITKLYNEQWGTLCTPSRSGYTFEGWYTSSSGGTEIKSNTKAKSDVTASAHWVKNTVAAPSVVLLVTDGDYYALDTNNTIIDTRGYFNVLIKGTITGLEFCFEKGLDSPENEFCVDGEIFKNSENINYTARQFPGSHSGNFDNNNPGYESYTRYYIDSRKITQNMKITTKVPYEDGIVTKSLVFKPLPKIGGFDFGLISKTAGNTSGVSVWQPTDVRSAYGTGYSVILESADCAFVDKELNDKCKERVIYNNITNQANYKVNTYCFKKTLSDSSRDSKYRKDCLGCSCNHTFKVKIWDSNGETYVLDQNKDEKIYRYQILGYGSSCSSTCGF